MPEHDHTPKMLRLGNPELELRRKHPLSDEPDAEPSVDELEQSWDEGSEPETPKQRRSALALGSAIVVGVLAVTATIAYWRREAPPGSPLPVAPTTLTSAERREQISDRLRGFFEADSTQARLEFVMEPDRVAPAIEDYYANQNPTPLEFATVDEFHFILLNDHPWCWAKVRDGDSRQILAGMKETALGYKLDWEAMVAYGEKSWEQLLDERPERPVQMRVYLSHNDYHNFKYADAETYKSFEIEPPNDGPTIFGYVERGTRTHALLLAIVAPGFRQPANITLRFESDAGADNLAVIDEVIHRQWTAPSVSAREEL